MQFTNQGYTICVQINNNHLLRAEVSLYQFFVADSNRYDVHVISVAWKRRVIIQSKVFIRFILRLAFLHFHDIRSFDRNLRQHRWNRKMINIVIYVHILSMYESTTTDNSPPFGYSGFPLLVLPPSTKNSQPSPFRISSSTYYKTS